MSEYEQMSLVNTPDRGLEGVPGLLRLHQMNYLHTQRQREYTEYKVKRGLTERG